jgi:ankyrin repeat protein
MSSSKTDNEGFTPLMEASYWGRVEAAKLLIAQRVNLNQANAQGHTAIMFAIINGHSEVAQTLMNENPLLLLARDLQGKNILALILTDPEFDPVGGKKAAVERLLSLNSQLAAQSDNSEKTPLMLAEGIAGNEGKELFELIRARFSQ